MARYLVDAERFYLDALYFNKEIIPPVEAQRHSIEELYYSGGLPREGRPPPTEVPKLNGVEAVDNNDIPYFFKQCYKNVKFPMEFSGGLLIVGDIAPDVLRGGMVDCFWNYGQTYELTFENERLYEAADKSDVPAIIREKRLGTHLYFFKSDATSQEVKAEVLSLFSTKYSLVY
jgi:hypothetical protein